MNRPLPIHAWWSRFGLWLVLFFVVLSYGFRSGEPGWAGLLMSLSITWSIATGVRLLCNCSAPFRFWLPYVVKWLSWWCANFAASSFATALLWMSGWALLALPIVLILPTIRLIIHAGRDIREVQWVRDAHRGGLENLNIQNGDAFARRVPR